MQCGCTQHAVGICWLPWPASCSHEQHLYTVNTCTLLVFSGINEQRKLVTHALVS